MHFFSFWKASSCSGPQLKGLADFTFLPFFRHVFGCNSVNGFAILKNL